MKNVDQDSRFPGRDMNPGPPEYEARPLAGHTAASLSNITSYFGFLRDRIPWAIGGQTNFSCVSRLAQSNWPFSSPGWPRDHTTNPLIRAAICMG